MLKIVFNFYYNDFKTYTMPILAPDDFKIFFLAFRILVIFVDSLCDMSDLWRVCEIFSLQNFAVRDLFPLLTLGLLSYCVWVSLETPP